MNQHNDKWVIVNAPPRGLLSYTTFDTEAAARKALDGLRRSGNGHHAYLQLPTAGSGVFV